MTRDDIVSLVVGCFERTVTKDAFTSLVDSATHETLFSDVKDRCWTSRLHSICLPLSCPGVLSMNEIPPQLLEHILRNLHVLLIRDALLDLFTETEKTPAHLVDTMAVLDGPGYIYTGKLLDIWGSLYSVMGVEGIRLYDGTPVAVTPLNLKTAGQLCLRNSKITLQKRSNR